MSAEHDKHNAESVTLLIQQKIKPDRIADYEKWLPKIVAKAAEFEGHQGVHVIRPPAGGTEYSIVIHYASTATAEQWLKSAERKNLIKEISGTFDVPDQTRIHPGIDFWFTPPTVDKPRPRGWKQWLVTTSVIWPLTIVIPWLYRPLFEEVPLLAMRGIREGIVACTVVALVVFLIMPRYVRAVSGWLSK